ncbi:MAG: HDOD domain-containing protein [Deltaproteobacteria bacterium]|nr:HDOD domain-containing protein [Deltaproteobacteria bacterium]
MESPEPIAQKAAKMLNRDRLEEVLLRFMSAKDPDIPALPAVVLQLKALVSQDDFSADELANVAQADQVLSATVLKYANRTAFMRNSSIISLQSAIARIGAHELVSIAFGSTLGAMAAKPGPLLNVRTRVWQEAVVSALLCQHLAYPFEVYREVAFLSGLLHDFGKVLALTALEQEFSKWEEPPEAPLSFWMDVIEGVHVELGVVAAEMWHLPDPLPDVIGAHHNIKSAGEHRKEVRLVQLSDELVQLLENAQSISGDELERLDDVHEELSRAHLERALSALPGAVSALTGHGRGLNRTAKNAVLSELPTFDDEDSSLHFTVTIEKDGREFPTKVCALSLDAICLRCQLPMPENFIAQLTVNDDEESFSLFANLSACVPEQQGYTLSLRPFCLSKENEEHWLTLVRKYKGH